MVAGPLGADKSNCGKVCAPRVGVQPPLLCSSACLVTTLSLQEPQNSGEGVVVWIVSGYVRGPWASRERGLHGCVGCYL